MTKLNIPKIHVNAEFQRLLWLNFSGGMVGGIALLVLLFVVSKSDDIAWSQHLALLGSSGLVISTIAAYILLDRSLRQDVSLNTFDQLRMSSLSPWQMASARLLVAPIMAWLVFIISWLFLVISTLMRTDFALQEITFLLIVLPLGAWSAGCLLLTNSLQFGGDNNRWTGAAVQVLMLFIITQLFITTMFTTLRHADFIDPFAHLAGGLIWQTIISSLLGSIMCSIALNAAMAYRLHLKPAGSVFLSLSLLSPLTTFWLWANWQQFAIISSMGYGILALLSIATQNTTEKRFTHAIKHIQQGQWRAACNTLPAWVVLLPLGTILAASVSSKLILTYGQIVAFAVVVMLCQTLRLRYNNISLALTLFLVLRALWSIMN